MRILIPLFVVLLLIGVSVNRANIRAENPLIEHKDYEKARVLDWMCKNSRMPETTLEEIYEEAHKYAFPDLLIAIAKVESKFDPGAVSSEGATGLMQVMSYVWSEELKQNGVIARDDDLFDISRCMAASAYILRKYLTWERGNLGNALKRYVGVRSETEYPQKVLRTLDEISAMRYEAKSL